MQSLKTLGFVVFACVWASACAEDGGSVLEWMPFPFMKTAKAAPLSNAFTVARFAHDVRGVGDKIKDGSNINPVEHTQFMNSDNELS